MPLARTHYTCNRHVNSSTSIHERTASTTAMPYTPVHIVLFPAFRLLFFVPCSLARFAGKERRCNHFSQAPTDRQPCRGIDDRRHAPATSFASELLFFSTSPQSPRHARDSCTRRLQFPHSRDRATTTSYDKVRLHLEHLAAPPLDGNRYTIRRSGRAYKSRYPWKHF